MAVANDDVTKSFIAGIHGHFFISRTAPVPKWFLAGSHLAKLRIRFALRDGPRQHVRHFKSYVYVSIAPRRHLRPIRASNLTLTASSYRNLTWETDAFRPSAAAQ
jgi:hypothetical protein